MAEIDDINKLFHDSNVPPIDVYRDVTTKHVIQAPMLRPRPLGCYVIDLVIHFIKMNTKRDIFHPQLHVICMDLVHRLLCYETRHSNDNNEIPRLDYKWRELWIHLVMLLKFLAQAKRLENEDALLLANKAANILNMFITFGDKFLPVQSDYDDLYYELMRARQELRVFIQEIEKYEKNVTRLGDLFNLKTILTHFDEKIDAWTRQNPGGTLSTENVLEIIKTNYETLKLKLQENLDKYEIFVENPNAVPYFRQLLRMLVTTTKNSGLEIL